MADEPTFDEYMKSGKVPLPTGHHARPHGASPAGAAAVGALLPPAEAGGDAPSAPEEYRANGISAKMVQKLQRTAPEGSLDMHGFTVAEAHMELESFLRGARQRGWRVVEVIHGRGLHSDGGGGGKLRGKTRHWLAHSACVLAYCSPAKNSGALLALLRQR